MLDFAIKNFFTSAAYAVIGASSNRRKYGNKVLRCYIQHNIKVYAVNPRADVIEGIPCFHSLSDLPNEVKSISVITPPTITESVVDEAIAKGIKNIWMQPGAESRLAIETCHQNNINVIAGGPCILVVLGYKE